MENKEQRTSSPPELIFPFGEPKEWKGDKNFEEDLGLKLVLRSHPYSGEITDRYRYSHQNPNKRTLDRAISLNTDIETAKYRQEIFRDLENPKVRERFGNLLNNLGRLSYSSGNKGISSGLSRLEDYIRVLENIPYFSDVESRGLREVGEYLKKFKDSEDTAKIRELIDSLRNVNGVEFKVSFNDSLQPERMSVLELKTKPQKVSEESNEKPQKRNFFEKLFGTKQYEESMAQQIEESEGDILYKIDYDGKRKLNDLGEIIDRFMSQQFSGAIDSYMPQINGLTKLGDALQFYNGFIQYFDGLRKKEFDISLPTLLPKEERRTSIKGARNPQLIEAENNGNRVIPNDIETNPDKNMYVITGPNNGGKTTYIKTVGLIQLMAQSGLPIPAISGEVSMVDGIYTHFVAPDDITKGEGRYRNELRRMKEIFEKATPYSLVLLDEPCGGTSYEEGQRQSLVLLDGFHKLSSATYFTTHMHPLTKEVDNGRYPGARNLQVECKDNGEKIDYTYRVIPGSSGKSYGEEIAREIGLRDENIRDTILKNAEERGYQKHIRQNNLAKQD